MMMMMGSDNIMVVQRARQLSPLANGTTEYFTVIVENSIDDDDDGK